MITYILYENGKLKMKEKEDNKNIMKKKCPPPVLITPPCPPQLPPSSLPIQQQQKNRSLVEPPLTDSLKNTNIFTQSKPSKPYKPLTSSKKIKVNDLQLDLFSQLCKIININSSNPIGSEIPFEKLQDTNVIKKLYDIQDKLKDAFPSSKLTALHMNALKKQSFPGVNIVRQIFKAMGYKLRPINTSHGYVGNKKILQRVYHIEKL